MKRKEHKEASEAASGSGVVDVHHVTDGTRYFIYSKTS